MVSRENTVIALFVALAFLVLAVVPESMTRTAWTGAAVVLVVGVVCPTLVNEYLDGRAS
jgi:predicted membrane channel-forming protein YqfA (hemolysin III family)